MASQEAELIRRLIESVPISYRKVYSKALHGKSRTAAVKAKCLECCAWQRRESGHDRIGDCGIRSCPLWAFRPFQTKDEGNDA